MKKTGFILFAAVVMAIGSCNNNSATGTQKDSVVPSSPDSAANNGILPPSANPGDAGNSSLADTAYKANDTTKKK